MVRIWYVALSSADLHVERVAQRVERRGHGIPEADIRRRYDTSRVNVADLLTLVHEARVFDNSANFGTDPPRPMPVVHVVEGVVVDVLPLDQVPAWAKPIVAAALAGGEELPNARVGRDPD